MDERTKQRLIEHIKSQPKHAIWFTNLFGYYITLKDKRKHRLLFSERNGYGMVYRKGNYVLSIRKVPTLV